MTFRFARLLSITLVATIAAPAHAATYFFTGQCSDCLNGIGSATATLVLRNYTPGAPILSSNLVSFRYDGTDLVAPFVITSDTVSAISGAMPQNPPAFASFEIALDELGLFRVFTSEPNGNWGIDDDGADDFGTNGTWSVAVPEPSYPLMAAFGLVAFAIAYRLRRR